MDLHALDLEVNKALAAVTSSAPSQLRVVHALAALADACAADGVLRGLVVEFATSRREAFVAFHERRVAAGIDASAVQDAAEFARGVGAEVVIEAVTMSTKQAESRPFFARFLEQQER